MIRAVKRFDSGCEPIERTEHFVYIVGEKTNNRLASIATRRLKNLFNSKYHNTSTPSENKIDTIFAEAADGPNNV